MVGITGLESVTSAGVKVASDQLSYGPAAPNALRLSFRLALR